MIQFYCTSENQYVIQVKELLLFFVIKNGEELSEEVLDSRNSSYKFSYMGHRQVSHGYCFFGKDKYSLFLYCSYQDRINKYGIKVYCIFISYIDNGFTVKFINTS